MNADIEGALENLGKSWRVFEHKGKPMSKKEVETVLKYGLDKGYKTTNELSDDEIDSVLKKLHNVDLSTIKWSKCSHIAMSNAYHSSYEGKYKGRKVYKHAKVNRTMGGYGVGNKETITYSLTLESPDLTEEQFINELKKF
jgi:hypothetical protein